MRRALPQATARLQTHHRRLRQLQRPHPSARRRVVPPRGGSTGREIRRGELERV
jgi:hypothetical protein